MSLTKTLTADGWEVAVDGSNAVSAKVNATASGNTAVVAAQGDGVKIRVLSAAIVSTLAHWRKSETRYSGRCPSSPPRLQPGSRHWLERSTAGQG
jgi:hypothetical protein